MIKQYQAGRLFLGRLTYGEDLLKELSGLCESRNIQMGTLQVIGAVQSACLGFYQQKEKRYQRTTLSSPAEITSCLGNISSKEGKIFIHAHLTLADEQGNVFGGHLMPGTTVFAAEFQIRELQGEILHRGEDAATGLALWS